MVHLLHPLSGRDLAGPPRGAAQLPDGRDLAHGHADRQLLAARRGDGRGRGDADDVRAALARGRQGGALPALRRPQHLPPDARRAAHAQRALRHRAHRRRLRRLRVHGPGVRRRGAVPGRRRLGARLRSLRGRGPRARRAGDGRRRPARARAAQGSGRVGRRHRRGLGPAPGHTDGLRRPERRLHGHARGLQAQHAGPHHRRLGRPPGPPRAAHGAPDARAAHQARTRHLEHLHRLGADGLDGGLLLRLQRPRGAAARRRDGPRGRRARGRGARGDGLRARLAQLLRHARGRGRGGRRAVAGPRERLQLPLPLRGARAPLVRRGDHRPGGRGRRPHLRRGQGTQGQGRQGRRGDPRRAAPHERLPRRAGLQQLPLRERPDALRQAARAARHLAGQLDDLARLVHHEAQRRGDHAAALAGRLPERAPLRPRRPDGGLPRADRRAGARPCDDHRPCGLLAATQLGRRGRVCGPDGHPRLPPEPRPGLPQRGADPRLGPRHQPRVGGHGRHEDRHGGVRRARQHRRRRPAPQGRRARLGALRPDGDLPLDARRLREPHPRDRRRGARRRRPGLHGRRQHERPGGAHQPGLHRRRRLPPQPPQDLRHAPRRRRSGRGSDLRGRAPAALPAVALGRGHGRRRGNHGRGVGPVGLGHAAAHHLRLHQDAGRRRTAPRHRDGHRQRQLHVGGPGVGVPHLLLGRDGPRGPRDDPRPDALQARLRHRLRRHRPPADGLRLPRPHALVPRARDADGRAHRVGAQGRDGPLHRGAGADQARVRGGGRRG